MKFPKRHYRAAAALSGLIVGASLAQHCELSSAFAADDKIFAPQICVPLAAESDLSGYAAYRHDHIRKVQPVTNDYQTFVCPLVRDIVAGSLDQVWVRVGNAFENEGEPPECCVYRVSLGGTSSEFECKSAKDELGRQSISIPGFPYSNLYDYGHYVVICELAADDTIHSIRTIESEAP